jgi:putative transposase
MSNYKRIFEDGYSYYLTVVTHRRNPILIENIALLRESFVVSKKKYDYRIDAITILPDHFHMIITPKDAKEYPYIIRTIKQHFTKHCPKNYYENVEQSMSRHKEGYKAIWQKRYYEHTIRNEIDFKARLEYIYNNPIKHGYVDNIDEWEYSSYRRVDTIDH